MLHNRGDLLQTALRLAKGHLTTERRKLDIATIAYLVAVAEHDTD
jgi:hypothetical protein